MQQTSQTREARPVAELRLCHLFVWRPRKPMNRHHSSTISTCRLHRSSTLFLLIKTIKDCSLKSEPTIETTPLS
eukprot:scaffold5529_cov117-Cylindrotheca_fusiformis.AAC.22